MNTPATLDDVKTEIKNLETRMESRMDSKFATKTELKSELQKHSNKINKKLDIIISFFDNEHLSLKKRVTRIEDHLNLTPIT